MNKIMFPTDSEFLLLYLFYGFLFLYLIFESFKTNKLFYRINLIIYVIYTSIMIYIFLDKNNFKGGASLVVLLLGALFIIIHYLIIFLNNFLKYIRNK